jgi:tetratricopeptide (TPR) repeat protein
LQTGRRREKIASGTPEVVHLFKQMMPKTAPTLCLSAIMLAALFTMSFSAGCATTRKAIQEKPPAQELFMEPLHIGVKPDRELGLVDFDAASLYQEGLRFHESGRCDRAVAFYDRLIEEFSASRYFSAAAFNAGRCLEELDRTEEAVQRYRIITRGLEKSKDWVDAGFRESLCLSRLERHAEATRLLDKIVNRGDLTVSDRIDALVLKGEAQKKLGELMAAESTFRRVLRIYRKRERDEYLDPVPAARAEFRLSEMAEERFQAAPLRLPEERMNADLEAKAALLLRAQSGYLRTIRYGDPQWATAAGYRIGSLYLHLHKAMEQAPVPDDLSEDEARVYRDLLRKRTAVLLRKALKVFQMTVDLSERTFTKNRWTQAAREQIAFVENQVLSLYEDLPDAEPSEEEKEKETPQEEAPQKEPAE